jgi:hypothetical protein
MMIMMLIVIIVAYGVVFGGIYWILSAFSAPVG